MLSLNQGFYGCPVSMNLAANNESTNDNLEVIKPSKKKRSLWRRMRTSKRRNVSRTKMVECTDDTTKPVVADKESSYSLEQYLSKLQEEWRFVQKEVIIEDLVLPLKEDMEILQTKFKQVVFPGESSCITDCTSSALSSTLSSELSGENSEYSNNIPRTISNLKCGIKRADNGPKQQILANNISPKTKRNKGVLSKGLGKNRPNTVFVDSQMKSIEKQKWRWRSPATDCRNRSLSGARMVNANHKTKSPNIKK